jgi:maltose alpha-D-glucosyltransferase/alpha-amylase
MMASPDRNGAGLDLDPSWYKSGVFYEVHVRAFFDANADGAGDFRGLTQKLDYIKDLGVTALWLLPFYPSPLKDDGYDIADYYGVHPMYGTLADFKHFLRQAHRRGLRVITELVVNHTSDQHPWFQRARCAKPGSRWRNFYVWSDSPEKYRDARIIFKDVEASNWTWDRAANAYFWHRFFSHQPDLNYENPEVHEKLIEVVDFWLDLGVDGLRLDAVPYLYEREGTTCENLPETHAFLKSLRAHVDAKYSDRMLLAEANQWPEDAVAYFGQGRGDECHMAFHFPLMPRLFMALRMEDRLPIVDILEQTPPIPETGQWALFLRNHDELTLEMVTDEERDYMYRMYTQTSQARLNLGIRRRLAPLLSNDRKSIELLNALLFSLPGTPVLYYGDEIGLGENIYLGDRNGVRTPMQWSSDKNAGFSRANPQSLYLPIILDPAYHYEACNVEAQLTNPHSLLWWMRRLLALRKRWRALGEGKCEFLQPDNHKILSYVLRHGRETILVVANLSRFAQPVELDLSAFKSMAPIELFGRMRFPTITDAPYPMTLGPHNFYWFSLEPKPQPAPAHPEKGSLADLPPLAVVGDWEEVLASNARARVEAVLPDWLRSQPWFASRSASIKLAALREVFKLPLPDGKTCALALLQVEVADANPALYSLPLALADGDEAARVRENGIAELVRAPGSILGVLRDASACPAFAGALLELIRNRERVRNERGEIEATRGAALRQVVSSGPVPDPVVHDTGDGNATAVFGDKLVLKVFRGIEPGIHPELEISCFLTERRFPHAPALLGSLELREPGRAPATLAVLKSFIPRATNGWKFTLDALSRYYDRAIASAAQGPPPADGPAAAQPRGDPAAAADDVGTSLEAARLLGVRLADLHLALGSGGDGEEFSAEPMTPHHLRGVFQSMRSLATQTLRLMRKQIKFMTPELAQIAQRVAEREPVILQRYRQFVERRIDAKRIRIHGDLHLGQVFWTGRDFVFLDFSGDTSLPVSERRIKRSPLRDVACMLRSLHRAADAGLRRQVELGVVSNESLPKFEPSVLRWRHAVSGAFLQAYCQTLRPSGILPADEETVRAMLLAYALHQEVEALGRELDHPDALRVPLQAILRLTEEQTPPLASTAPATEPGSPASPPAKS